MTPTWRWPKASFKVASICAMVRPRRVAASRSITSVVCKP